MSDEQGAAGAADTTGAAVEATDAVETTEGDESQDGGSETDQSAADKAAVKTAEKAVKEEIKKYKLKYKDSEEEVDEKELIRRAQLSTGAQKSMQRSAQLEKEAMALVHALKTNPRSVLSHPDIGIDVLKFAQEELAREMERAAKSPEEIEKEKMIQERDEYKKQLDAMAEEKKVAKFEALRQEQQNFMDESLDKAMTKHKLPDQPEALARVASILDSIINADELITEEHIDYAVKAAKDRYVDQLRNTPEDLLEEFLGKERINSLIKRDLSKVKTPAQSASAAVKEGGKKVESAPKKVDKVSVSKWLKPW